MTTHYLDHASARRAAGGEVRRCICGSLMDMDMDTGWACIRLERELEAWCAGLVDTVTQCGGEGRGRDD